MKLLIPLLLIAFSTFTDGSGKPSGKWRNEFRTIATSRLDYMLKHNPSADSYLTMLFVVVNCVRENSSPYIKTVGNETILEEAICGTQEMYDWCKEGGSEQNVVLMASSKKSNRTALSHFMCSIEHFAVPNVRFEYPREIIDVLINFMFVLAIIAIFMSWRNKLSRPIPIHPSNILNLTNRSDSAYPSDSFENITLNSTQSITKSRIANSNRSSFNFGPKKFRIIV